MNPIVIIPPSSKSYSHRYLISAFIKNESVRINNVNFCDDVKCTYNALKRMGGIFKKDRNGVVFYKRKIVKDNPKIYVGASASTLRMLIPLAISLFSSVTFYGSPSLFLRPLDVYLDFFKAQNIDYSLEKDKLIINGCLKDVDYLVSQEESSQFVSGMLFYFAFIKSNHLINVAHPENSRSYIYMTLKSLNDFGYCFDDSKGFYLAKVKDDIARSFTIESDFSSVANLVALSLFKKDVLIKNIPSTSLQGDASFIKEMIKIGADIKFIKGDLLVKKSSLMPFTIDINDCIDLGPLYFVIASNIIGESKISGYERLKIKESDRIKNICDVFAKFGITFKEDNKVVLIKGKKDLRYHGYLDGFMDHRLIMSLVIFSIIHDLKIKILDKKAVKKSYPNFFKDIKRIIQ